jgi:hypothetical protein
MPKDIEDDREYIFVADSREYAHSDHENPISFTPNRMKSATPAPSMTMTDLWSFKIGPTIFGN